MTFLRSSEPAPDWLLQALPNLSRGGSYPFDDFVQVALYHQEFGYYQRERARVGRTSGHDFATASSVGPLFGKLVRAATVTLATEAGFDPSEMHLVEVGAESDQGVFHHDPGPYASVSIRRLGAALTLPANSVVFSNELFDAQPFKRFQKTASHWIEHRVALDAGGHLTEVPGLQADLTVEAPEGWIVDLPSGAVSLLRQLAEQRWNGLFIAFDYGREWHDLLESAPEGTARAYHRQTQHNRLLDQPGEQDLTCHVVWDHLREILVQNRFHAPLIERQEAFFLRHAANAVAEVFREGNNALSANRRALASLLHPAHFGSRFQVLHAIRKQP